MYGLLFVFMEKEIDNNCLLHSYSSPANVAYVVRLVKKTITGYNINSKSNGHIRIILNI